MNREIQFSYAEYLDERQTDQHPRHTGGASILQGKGDRGKSLIASFLAQILQRSRRQRRVRGHRSGEPHVCPVYGARCETPSHSWRATKSTGETDFAKSHHVERLAQTESEDRSDISTLFFGYRRPDARSLGKSPGREFVRFGLQQGRHDRRIRRDGVARRNKAMVSGPSHPC